MSGRVLLVWVLLLVFSSGLVFAASPEEVLNQYYEADQSEDIETLMELTDFSHVDAEELDEFRADTRTMLESLAEIFNTNSYSLTDVVVEESGDDAIVSYHLISELEDAEGETANVDMDFVAVMHKVGGNWKITYTQPKDVFEQNILLRELTISANESIVGEVPDLTDGEVEEFEESEGVVDSDEIGEDGTDGVGVDGVGQQQTGGAGISDEEVSGFDSMIFLIVLVVVILGLIAGFVFFKESFMKYKIIIGVIVVVLVGVVILGGLDLSVEPTEELGQESGYEEVGDSDVSDYDSDDGEFWSEVFDVEEDEEFETGEYDSIGESESEEIPEQTDIIDEESDVEEEPTPPVEETQPETETIVPDNAHEGPIAYYQFEGDASDSSSSNFDGEVHGAVFVNGKIGEALSFDGVDDYMQAAGTYNFSATNQITITAWFKLTDHESYDGIVCSKSTDYGCCEYRIMVDPDREPFYNAGKHWDNTVSDYELDDGIWYHYAMTVVGGGQAKIYLDGELIHTSGRGVASELPDITDSFIIGMDVPGGTESNITPNHPFAGLIDEVRIYDRVLTAAEIGEIASE